MPCSSSSCSVISPVSTDIEPLPPRADLVARIPVEAFAQRLSGPAFPPPTPPAICIPPELEPEPVPVPLPVPTPGPADPVPTTAAGPLNATPVLSDPSASSFSQNPPACGSRGVLPPLVPPPMFQPVPPASPVGPPEQ